MIKIAEQCCGSCEYYPHVYPDSNCREISNTCSDVCKEYKPRRPKENYEDELLLHLEITIDDYCASCSSHYFDENSECANCDNAIKNIPLYKKVNCKKVS
jgi:hypothetical protein